jgi:hypothetical protein
MHLRLQLSSFYHKLAPLIVGVADTSPYFWNPVSSLDDGHGWGVDNGDGLARLIANINYWVHAQLGLL